MTPAARIQAILELLERVMDQPKPADTLVQGYFRTRRYAGSKDRAYVTERIYRILRHWYRLNWHIEEASPRALFIADFVLQEGAEPGDLVVLFSGEKYAPSPLSNEEIQLIESLKDRALEPENMPEDVRLECPPDYKDMLRSVFGERFEEEMQAMQGKAAMTLRVNTLKAARGDVMKELARQGIDCVRGAISPLAITVMGKAQIMANELFKNGSVEIQDEGSQAVAMIAQAKPGEKVLDFCAGAGGKTLALAAGMENSGVIVAADVLAGKLKSAKSRLKRAGVHNAETRVLQADGRDQWLRRQEGRFDLVLVDAPCSGTGTWRRTPDARWKEMGPDLRELLGLQSTILDRAAPCVKPGGRLVYATCSLLREENEHQIEAFCKNHPEFQVVPLSDVWPEEKPPCQDPYLRLFPAEHGTDGFFAAVLVRA